MLSVIFGALLLASPTVVEPSADSFASISGEPSRESARSRNSRMHTRTSTRRSWSPRMPGTCAARSRSPTWRWSG